MKKTLLLAAFGLFSLTGFAQTSKTYTDDLVVTINEVSTVGYISCCEPGDDQSEYHPKVHAAHQFCEYCILLFSKSLLQNKHFFFFHSDTVC